MWIKPNTSKNYSRRGDEKKRKSDSSHKTCPGKRISRGAPGFLFQAGSSGMCVHQRNHKRYKNERSREQDPGKQPQSHSALISTRHRLEGKILGGARVNRQPSSVNLAGGSVPFG
ncbi:hypothetical protein POX_c04343 [Penicillium oxalicum]|uniref:Uncharacterized protein n=1 Tax=Penicillium oxalicum (strain 114-2 / CGMCC 5302) TaxID=933388 RepID=S8AJK4_PENO1|nr:hypothetical protein POX_c04343 [Penicillium oxalicum]EPS25968.1 hypothetical protein PDE_00904 [Penicillium oxalicum 114-2]KAI2791482.1 hypothetical protein POX_c04343 [Penicillium oxalicum]